MPAVCPVHQDSVPWDTISLEQPGLVPLHLGFGILIREYLRLRGIDAPEMDTAEGKKAREFVERELGKADHVILSSTRPDKYGRYLADVFYGAKDEQYLNQRLLDEGLAVPFS